VNLARLERPQRNIHPGDMGLTMGASHKCLRLAAAVCATLSQLPATAQDNPLARAPAAGTTALIDGRWNGANLERRSNCTAAQNNGTRGTYAEFVVSTNGDGDIGITETAITGLICNYFGKYRIEGANRSATGTCSCNDGKRGNFQTKGILVTGTALSIRMDIQLESSETCTIDAIIGGSRLP
jgi:hypothetical protein